jgi:ABC-type nitrate/sulfonate/bicarbonate transport system substrate-binding protein
MYVSGRRIESIGNHKWGDVMKRRTFLMGAGAALGGIAAGFPRPAVVMAQGKPLSKITIGYQSLWAGGGEIFETLRHTNILELNGIEADFKTFTFGGPLGEAAVAGSIDNIYAADAPTLRAISRIPGSKVLHRTHDQRFGIVVRNDFKGSTLADLKGAKLSGPFGTTVFPRSIQAVIAAGIKEPFKDITIINQDVAEQAESLKGGLVDAVTTWDPTYERLLQQKIGRELWRDPKGSSGIQGLSGPWLARNGEEAAVRFLKAWIIATWWTSNNLAQADQWFAQTSRLDASLLRVATEADRYLRAPVKDIKTLDLTVTDAEISESQRVIDFLHEQKLLTARIDAASYYDRGPLSIAQKHIAAGDFPDPAKIKVVG